MDQNLRAFLSTSRKRKSPEPLETFLSPAKKRNLSGDSQFEFDWAKDDDSSGTQPDGGPSLGPGGEEAGAGSGLSLGPGGEEGKAVAGGPSLGPGSSAVREVKRDLSQDQFEVLLQEIRQLSVKVDSLKKTDSKTSGEQQEQLPQSQAGLDQRFHEARNIQDLLKLNLGLQYDERTNVLFCPCSPQAHFKCPDTFSSDNEEEDQDLVQDHARQFRNLKTALKRHPETICHKSYVSDQERDEEENKKYRARNQEAGLNLGRIIYMLAKLGRPFSDYEEQVLMAKAGGVTVGDKQHSRKFPSKLINSLSDVVKEDLKKFFTTPLIQTGSRPFIALSGDGATHKHFTRQFIACVTINPDGENFLEAVSIGQPILREGGSGIKLTENIKQSLDEFGINYSQISSMACDGVYVLRHVQHHLEDLCGAPAESIPLSHDWLHQLGLVDKHVSKQENFNWLITVNEVCSSAHSLFNWGNLAARLQTETLERNKTFKQLHTFSATRFANSKYLVYKNLLDMIVPICSVLDEDIAKDEKNKAQQLKGIERRDPGIKKRGEEARELRTKLFNRDTLLRLAGVVCVYRIYSKIVNIVQMVHLLPFQRFDAFQSGLRQLEEMTSINSQDYNLYKKIKQSLEESGKIDGLEIKENFRRAAPNSFLQTRGMKATEDSQKEKDQDLVLNCEKDLMRLAKELSSKMSGLVSDSELKRIEAGRQILDVRQLMIYMRSSGPSLGPGGEEAGAGSGPSLGSGKSPILTSAEKFTKLKENIRILNISELDAVDDETLARQFTLFLTRLQHLCESQTSLQIQETDPLIYIKKLFASDKKLYEGIEMILNVQAAAATSVSVESYVESLVSTYEHHFYKARNPGEDTINAEFNVAVNGPVVNRSERLIKRALDKHFGGRSQWNFFKADRLRKTFLHNSQVLERLEERQNKFPFM